MDKQGNAPNTNERNHKGDPLEPEPGSLENLNVTGPAPIDQPAGPPTRAQPAEPQRQGTKQPSPPK